MSARAARPLRVPARTEPPIRILLINPNTSESVTTLVTGHARRPRSGRFSIVTGGALWRPILTEIARDPGAALGLLAEACRDCVADGAEAVILGGAALAGLSDRMKCGPSRGLQHFITVRLPGRIGNLQCA